MRAELTTPVGSETLQAPHVPFFTEATATPALRQAQAAKAYLSDDELLNTLREIAAAGGVPGSFLEETVAPPQADVPASLLRARKGRGEAE